MERRHFLHSEGKYSYYNSLFSEHLGLGTGEAGRRGQEGRDIGLILIFGKRNHASQGAELLACYNNHIKTLQ